MTDRALMICCTKGRPDRIQEMLSSYKNTKGLNTTDMIFFLDKNDKRLAEYDSVLTGRQVFVEDPNYQTPMFNLTCKLLYPNYDYYGLINDDHVFRTKNWDIELIKTIKEKGGGFGLAHANALWHDSDVICRHPSAFLISANIIKALSYAIYPELRHFKLDTYFRDLTEPLGLLFFREDVIIEHMHLHVGKALIDDNYIWGYCAEEQAWGENKFAKWKLLYSERDRRLIKKAINKNKEGYNGREKD